MVRNLLLSRGDEMQPATVSSFEGNGYGMVEITLRGQTEEYRVWPLSLGLELRRVRKENVSLVPAVNQYKLRLNSSEKKVNEGELYEIALL